MQVIVLAQGMQTRLGAPEQVGYKQLLPLPECAGVPILVRTYRQLRMRPEKFDITIVSWLKVHAGVAGSPFHGDPFIAWRADLITLPDPGNSSLKGIHRVLHAPGVWSAEGDPSEDTIVLLGDVVYSWACLDALFKMSQVGGFVGTSDLSNSGGELWGVAWPRAMGAYMMDYLESALSRHPPGDDVYQCGQLRRWIHGDLRGDLRQYVGNRVRDGSYVAIDDYTRDIDTKEHLSLLPGLSVSAAIDDREHGLVWAPYVSQEVD